MPPTRPRVIAVTRRLKTKSFITKAYRPVRRYERKLVQSGGKNLLLIAKTEFMPSGNYAGTIHVRDGKKIVGEIHFMEYARPDGRTDLLLYRVGVKNTRKRQGIAQSMIEDAITIAREKDAARVILEAEVASKGAIPLYSKLGFKPVGPPYVKDTRKGRRLVCPMALDIEASKSPF